jgi:adenosylcobinamide-GDP ribazoletransferase
VRRALAFLTPLGAAAVPDARTLGWFPAVGAGIGAAVGAAWWSAEAVWPPLLAAAVVVAVDLAVTGLLHVDGLADTADGLLPQLPRDRRLAVMAEPAVGAYGVTAVVVVLGLRVAAFAALAPDVALVAALWCASRTAMAVTARAVPYVRSGGLATALLGGRWPPVAAVGLAGSMTLALLSDDGGQALLAVAGVVVGATAVAAAARRRLGGFTGDVLGAAGLLGETVGLVVAAASW